MQRIEEFRTYYNRTIHPELIRMERLRLRLLRLLFFSVLLLTGVIILEFYINILVLTLFLMVPIGFFITYLFYKIQQFRTTFKPQVINLIMDFIDEDLSYEGLTYNEKKSISKDTFKASRIFETDAPYYQAEDYIEGQRGNLSFKLCELDVKEYSNVRNALNPVFKGIFMEFIFDIDLMGEIIIWPRSRRKWITRAIRQFNWEGGKNKDDEIMTESFKEHFIVYATEDTVVAYILPESLQVMIMNYVEETGKDIYFSFLGEKIYAAIAEPKDILEPYIFRSNLSFQIVSDFFDDVRLALQIVEDFDNTH